MLAISFIVHNQIGSGDSLFQSSKREFTHCSSSKISPFLFIFVGYILEVIHKQHRRFIRWSTHKKILLSIYFFIINFSLFFHSGSQLIQISIRTQLFHVWKNREILLSSKKCNSGINIDRLKAGKTLDHSASSNCQLSLL